MTKSTGIKKAEPETFSARAEQRGDVIVAAIRGNADMAAHERLKLFLDELDASARTNRTRETVFELQELYFMNSTCLSLFLRFINGIVAAKPADQYRLRFRSNANLRWQRKSLEALRAYADDLVVVE